LFRQSAEEGLPLMTLIRLIHANHLEKKDAGITCLRLTSPLLCC